MQVMHSRLRYGNQLLLLAFLPEVARHEFLYHFALDVLGEPLANYCRWHFAFSETRDPGELLVFLDDRLSLFRDNFGRNFDSDLARATFVRSFCSSQ
jgi:hypothetical protein